MENDFLKQKTKLADDMNENDYETGTGIDNFGKKMLYQMGWKDNTPVGKNGKVLVKPIELIPRNGRLGLGAVPINNQKDERKSKGDDEKKNIIGTKVRIVDGLHKGLNGIISESIYEDWESYKRFNDFVTIQLDLNNQGVKVKTSSIKIRSKEDIVAEKEKKEKKSRRKRSDSRSSSQGTNDHKHKKTKEKKELSRSRSKTKKKRRSRSRSNISRSNSNSRKNFEEEREGVKICKDISQISKVLKSNKKDEAIENDKSKRELKWVVPNILVRVISKKRLEGKYYNKKVKIVDIIDKYSFSIATNEGNILQDFKEKDIETVLPEINKEVVIVQGSHKGEIAKLLERDKKKNFVILQLIEDLSIIQLTQDDCCYYLN